MTSKLTLVTTPIPSVPGYVNAHITIIEAEAAHPYDAGITEHLCISHAKLRDEITFYKEQGYTIKENMSMFDKDGNYITQDDEAIEFEELDFNV